MLPAQNDQLVTGDCLKSGSSIYHVQSILGKGSFSMVAKCTRMDDMKIVAIKMMKNEDAYVMQAKAEVGKQKDYAHQSVISTIFVLVMCTVFSSTELACLFM